MNDMTFNRMADTLDRIASAVEQIAQVLKQLAHRRIAADTRSDDPGPTTLAAAGAATLLQPQSPHLAEPAQATVTAQPALDSGWASTVTLSCPPVSAGDSGSRADHNPLIDYLQQRRVTIKTLCRTPTSDRILDSLAHFIATRYEAVRPLMLELKRNQGTGGLIDLDLTDKPSTVVSDVCQLATRLRDLAFLSHYRYSGSPRRKLQARPSRDPVAINFLTGGWLERYVRQRVLTTFAARNPAIPLYFLCNPQVLLPNGRDFEFDLLVMAGPLIYWFEMKTGEHRSFLDKYSDVADMLGLPSERCVMVLAEAPAHTVADLTRLYPLTVVNLDSIGDYLSNWCPLN